MSSFDKVYKQYDLFMKIFNLYKSEEIISFLGLKGNETIADFGGGTGHLANKLSEHCEKIYVVDESEKMLSKINKNNKVIPKKGNIIRTTFKDNSFDYVLLTDVLHHVKNQNRLIREIRRVLKKDGKLLIMDFNPSYKRVKLLGVIERLLFRKIYYKNCGFVINLLLTNDFKKLKVENNSYFYLVMGE